MKRIVIADDFRKWRGLCEKYARQLESMYGPFGISSFENPDSAFAKLQSQNPLDFSLLVTDIDFTAEAHDRRGLALMRNVRNDRTLCNISIIGMTGNSDYEQDIRNYSAIYVPKTQFNPVMYEALEHLLQFGTGKPADVCARWEAYHVR